MYRFAKITPLQKSFFVLIAFAILFFPWVVKQVNPQGWLTVLYSPQVLFLFGSLWIYKSCGLYRNDAGLIHTRKNFYQQVVIVAIAIFALMYMMHVLLAPTEPVQQLQLIQPSIVQVVLLFILAPISEEIFFRGILFQSMLKRYSYKASMIVSSLVFMGTHGDLFLATFVLGLITCHWTYHSRSVYPGILFHAISNSFVLFAHKFAPNLGKIGSILFF